MSLITNIDLKPYFQLYLTNWKSRFRKQDSVNYLNLFNFVKYYFEWRYSLRKPYWEGPIQNGTPWMSLPAIDFIKKHLSTKDIVFEYGMGGSTVFFAKRVNKVISVEHDPDWFNFVGEHLNSQNIKNTNITCIQPESENFNTVPDPSNYEFCYSSTGFYFNSYVNSIQQFSDNYFDLVVVDGRARPSCIFKAISKIKPGKYLLIDNSERLHYQLAIDSLLKEWKRETFEGPTLYLKWFTQTSIWQKPLLK